MSRTRWASAILSCLILRGGLAAEAPSRPNIVLLFADDLGEKKNLAALEPEKLKKMIVAWQELNDEMIEPVWSPGW